MKKKYQVVLAISILFFIYFLGFFNGVKRSFPYLLLYNIKEDIKKVINKKSINFSKNDKSNCSIEDIFICFDLPQKVDFTNSSDLNNFYFDWAQIEINNLKKLSYFEFENNKINYLNQDDEKYLSNIGINEENLNNVINAGIKNIFKMNGKHYAYVAYRKEDCALVSIFEYPKGDKITDFPCLPEELDQVDLNGTGGAFLKFNNLNLLTTGTPTKSNEKIRNLAQDETSPYGKILKINIDENNNFEYKIFSKGHRNPQGITNNYEKVFAVEHGPRGGDELNLINENNNYGWPLYSVGSHYNLKPIEKENSSDSKFYKEPLFSFVPSIGISSVEKCPLNYEEYYRPLKCIAVGSMRAQSIYLILMNKNLNKVINYEKIEFPSRIRKFKFFKNKLIAGTDFNGIIIGKLELLNE